MTPEDFDDIRPYHDHEVKPVVETLLADLELSRALAKFKLPRAYAVAPGLMTRLVRVVLRRELQHLDSIHDVQMIIEKYLDRLIEKTTDGLTQSGLENLDAKTPYLFISNHRDITMDPALVNYMLYHHGFDTVQIAIGDNLLKRPFLTHLMKLNKSFIVKRSLQGREKLKASRQLSAYIHHCIDNGQNVWVAQREGRAKEGIDLTEAAIITMLHMADRIKTPTVPLWESMNSLNIVPVAISYEYDPCDESKAQELYAVDTQGRYEKDDNADVRSILKGMVGEKGAIHVSFGTPIVLEEAVTTEGMAQRIDEQIVTSYRLHLVNFIAMEMVQSSFMDFTQLPSMFGVRESVVKRKRQDFENHLASMAPELRPYVLDMYANPVIRKYEAQVIKGNSEWQAVP